MRRFRTLGCCSRTASSFPAATRRLPSFVGASCIRRRFFCIAASLSASRAVNNAEWIPTKHQLQDALSIATMCVKATDAELKRLEGIKGTIVMGGCDSVAGQMAANAIDLNLGRKKEAVSFIESLRVLLDAKEKERMKQALAAVRPFFDGGDHHRVVASKLKPDYAIWL